MWCEYKIARRCKLTSPKLESAAASITQFRFTCRKLTNTSATRRAHSRSPSVSRPKSFPCRCFSNSITASRSWSQGKFENFPTQELQLPAELIPDQVTDTCLYNPAKSFL